MFNHLFTQDSFQSEGERRRKVLSIRQNTHLQSASTTVAPRDNIIDGRIRDGKGSRDPFWSRESFNTGEVGLAAVATGSISKLVFSCREEKGRERERKRGCRRVPGETHRGQPRVEPGDT